jgi:hypothetical protein
VYMAERVKSYREHGIWSVGIEEVLLDCSTENYCIRTRTSLNGTGRTLWEKKRKKSAGDEGQRREPSRIT